MENKAKVVGSEGVGNLFPGQMLVRTTMFESRYWAK